MSASPPSTRHVREPHGVTGRVRVAVHDLAVIRRHIPYWDALTPAEQARELRATAVPAREEHTSNVTCVGMDEAIVDALDPAQPGATAALDQLAVGNDDATAPAHTDTSLNNEVGERVDLTSSDDQGGDLFGSWFIGTHELNGFTFKEVGAYGTAGRLWNHALIADVSKTNTKTVTFEITFSYSNA